MSNAGTNPVRSPSYPSMSLADAIAAVRKIEAQYRTASVDRTDGAKLIGYSSLSGPANKALAALAHYGLVERAGKGEMRVTDRARAILHPATPQEKVEHLRWAALEPTLFRELQERFPNMTPPEDGVVTFLNRQGFNQSAIRPAAKAYLETLQFLEEAGATESHGAGGETDANLGESRGGDGVARGGARVGDLIDYESGGAIANPEPMRVRALSEDGKWVFVDGSETGLEMEQVIVKERPEGDGAAERPTLPLAKPAENNVPAGTRKAMFPLDEGDVILLFPEGLSEEGLDLLGSYLDIFLNREKSKTAKPENA